MRRIAALIILTVVITLTNITISYGQNTPYIIQDRRELFVDDFLVEKLHNIDFRAGIPVSGGIALRFNEPWEGRFCTYISIISDGKLFRMYYRGSSSQEVTCYAESEDGINWKKPRLGLFEVNGSSANNIVFADRKLPATHNFSVLFDNRKGVPAEERFKAVGGASNEKKPYLGLYRFVSSDGIHWTRYSKDTSAIFSDYALDSQNVITWVPAENCYAVYMRGWTNGKPGELYPANGVRTIVRSTSKDFLNWSEPVFMKFGNTPVEHLYTNATHPYFRAPHILISMPFRFSPSVKVLTDNELIWNGTDRSQWQGVADAVFMTSRGGNVYDRKFMESFVRPGMEQMNWGARSNIPAMGVIPTGRNEMSFFVTRAYGTKDVFLERMILRTDGFASLHAGYDEGYAQTKPVILQGNVFKINFSTSSVGYVKIILLDEKGKEIPGFGEADFVKLTGDKIDANISWTGGKSLKDINNKKVCIKFIARDADIYSFGVFDR